MILTVFVTAPVLEIALDCYPYYLGSPPDGLDEMCALYEYFVNIAPMDRMFEEVELGIKKPNLLNGLSLKNFGKKI